MAYYLVLATKGMTSAAVVDQVDKSLSLLRAGLPVAEPKDIVQGIKVGKDRTTVRLTQTLVGSAPIVSITEVQELMEHFNDADHPLHSALEKEAGLPLITSFDLWCVEAYVKNKVLHLTAFPNEEQ